MCDQSFLCQTWLRRRVLQLVGTVCPDTGHVYTGDTKFCLLHLSCSYHAKLCPALCVWCASLNLPICH